MHMRIKSPDTPNRIKPHDKFIPHAPSKFVKKASKQKNKHRSIDKLNKRKINIT